MRDWSFDGRIQAGVTLHVMDKIRLQEGKYVEALQHVQEAVTIFREAGSTHADLFLPKGS